MRQYRNEILLGLFFLVSVAILVLMVRGIAGRGLEPQVTLTARFVSAAGLVPENPVMIAGVPVGTVERIDVDFDHAVVRMRVNRSAAVREDTLARIRAKSLLGEKFLELVPRSQTARLLNDGESLKEGELAPELDQLFAQAGPLLEKMEPLAPKLGDVLDELDALLSKLNETGENKKEVLERIVDRTDTLLGQVNTLLKKNEGHISQSLARLDDLTRTANARAPRLLDKTEALLTRAERIGQAVPVETLERIPETYAKVDRALDRVDDLLARMDGSSREMESIVKNLDTILKRVVRIDELALRKFLQEEGVNVNLTQDEASRERIEQLERPKANGENVAPRP